MHNRTINKLTNNKRAQVVAALVEGNSLRVTVRMCDVAFNTVLKLLPEVGRACADYQGRTLRSLKCKRIQCDEIWSFCYAREKDVPPDKGGQFGHGDIWTSAVMGSDTKLVPSFMGGNQELPTSRVFVDDPLRHCPPLRNDGSVISS